ncbi:MAG TPA: polysaccharide deacetylase family protein [Candidatus Dormibacteraeota bacterium]|nr:polysaccharide deacetylase family protein [Candidatus Dormibacteraeota bacterium]
MVPERLSLDPVGNCVTIANFESHLRWLAANGFSSVPLSVAGSACDAGITEALPARSVVITFDDGYSDNYDFAWPLLKRYGFTATIFLVSDAVGGYNHFDAGLPGDPIPMLRWDQVREMHAAGIEFGSHTCSHPDSLIRLDDERLRYEVAVSKATLEEGLNTQVEEFSYPHDQLDARVEAAVEAAGYRLACAGVATRFSRYCMSRVSPPRGGDISLVLGLLERRLKWSIRNRLRPLPIPSP